MLLGVLPVRKQKACGPSAKINCHSGNGELCDKAWHIHPPHADISPVSTRTGNVFGLGQGQRLGLPVTPQAQQVWRARLLPPTRQRLPKVWNAAHRLGTGKEWLLLLQYTAHSQLSSFFFLKKKVTRSDYSLEKLSSFRTQFPRLPKSNKALKHSFSSRVSLQALILRFIAKKHTKSHNRDSTLSWSPPQLVW